MLHELQNNIEGLYFSKRSSILKSKADDVVLLESLCPQQVSGAVSLAKDHLLRIVLQCNACWDTLAADGLRVFWREVASKASSIVHIELRVKMARQLVLALVKARQRYLIRQNKVPEHDITLQHFFIASIQSLLEKFQAQRSDPTSDKVERH